MDNLEIAKKFFRSVENEQLDQLDEFIHPDYITKDIMINEEASQLNIIDNTKLHLAGVEGLRTRLNQLYNQFSDIEFDIFETVCENDKVVLHYTMEMTHSGYWNGFPPTDKRLKIIGAHLIYFKDEKIIRIVAILSMVDMLKQIGSSNDPLSDHEIMGYLARVKTFLDI